MARAGDRRRHVADAARRTHLWLAAGRGYGLASIYGLIFVNNQDANILTINGADNALHILSTPARPTVALIPDRRRVAA